MKIQILRLSVFAAITLLASACDRGSIDSNLLAQDERGNNNIFRSYRVDSAEGEALQMASAVFSVGSEWGTTVKLIEPASLTINQQRAQENPHLLSGRQLGAFFLGFIFPPAWLLMADGDSMTRYASTIGSSTKRILFEFNDQFGERFIDEIRLPQLSLSLPEVASRAGFEVFIPGAGPESRISVQIQQEDLFKSIGTNGSFAHVSASDLNEFTQGVLKVKVEVRRSEGIAPDLRSLGGEKNWTYSFSERTIELW